MSSGRALTRCSLDATEIATHPVRRVDLGHGDSGTAIERVCSRADLLAHAANDFESRAAILPCLGLYVCLVGVFVAAKTDGARGVVEPHALYVRAGTQTHA